MCSQNRAVFCVAAMKKSLRNVVGVEDVCLFVCTNMFICYIYAIYICVCKIYNYSDDIGNGEKQWPKKEIKK